MNPQDTIKENQLPTRDMIDSDYVRVVGTDGQSYRVPASSLDVAVSESITDWLDENVTPVGSAVIVDSSLTISGAAADAKATGDALNTKASISTLNNDLAFKVNKPVVGGNPTDGTSGQLLQTNGDGSTTWVNQIETSDIANAVTDWLDDNVNPVGSAVVVDSSLSISGAAADAKITGDTIAGLRTSYLTNFTEYKGFSFTKGAINSTGGTNTSTTSRIRTTGATAPVVTKGDVIYIAPEYRAIVAAYNSSTISGNFYDWVVAYGSAVNGIIPIPDKFIGKYILLCIQKVGSESSDITADIPSIGDYAHYYHSVYKNIEEDETELKDLRDSVFFETVSLPFSESHMIGVSNGIYASNSSYKYLYAENFYQAVSKNNPAFVTMNDSSMAFRVHLYSDASESNFIQTVNFDGDTNLILNGELNGQSYKYVRFTIKMVDNSYSTAIFNSLVAAFQFKRKFTKLNARTDNQIHFNVTINPTYMRNDFVDADTELSVNAVLILPSSYTIDGAPTKAIFMHHGQSGKVTDTTWYTSVADWDDMYGAYLSAGFAVFDVNGSGPYSASDAIYHRDYGCSNGLQAAHKAYEYIVKNYNIDPMIFVHGSSMGGTTAVAFAKTYPGIVRAVSLFSPAELRGSATSDTVYDDLTLKEIVATNYGYADVAAMVADDYGELKAAYPTLEHYNSDGERQFHPFDYDWKNDATETHVAQFPVPIKIWHGTADTSTSPVYSEKLIDAIRLGGGMAFFRPVTGGTHTISTGSDSTVNAEAALWFERFI